MSNAGEEVIARILFFFVGLFLLFISFFVLLFVTILHDARQKNRRAAMALKANKLGLTYDEGPNLNIAPNYFFLDHLDGLTGGTDHYCLNVVSGDFNGHPVTRSDCLTFTTCLMAKSGGGRRPGIGTNTFP